MKSLAIIFVSLLLCFSADAQSNPFEAPVRCGTPDGAQTLDDPIPRIGSVHGLYVICAPDSHARPLSDTTGYMPTTYSMPYWSSFVFDTTITRSLNSYFRDVSFGNLQVTGDVVESDTIAHKIFVSDTNVWVTYDNYGGIDFFLDIMSKVDAVVDFNDFDSNHDGNVDFVFFNIYGVCNATDCKGGLGVAGLASEYTSNDTTSTGAHLIVDDGVSFWTNSVEFIPSNPMSSYWNMMAVCSHEFGHSLGQGHWGAGSHYGHGPHPALGSFDCMTSGGFAALNWGDDSPPSPYNAYSRTHILHWSTPTHVSAPLCNFSLQDYTGSSQLLKIPVNIASSNDQYFLVQSATRQMIWEENWPAQGLLIYHINPIGNQSSLTNKQLDSELQTGLWNWESYVDSVDPGWGSYSQGIYTLSTWTRLNQPNTITGTDSFDYWWAHNVPYARAIWDPARRGSRGNYFLPGDRFSFDTNPSSAAYVNGQQSAPSMVNIEVLNVDPVNHSCTINAWGRHWSGTVDASATWLDSVVVDNNLTMTSGSILTIQPGTVIRFAPGASLRIEGKIIASGAAENPIVFEAADPNQSWGGITIASDDPDNRLEHVIITHAGTGIRLNDGYAVIRDSEIGNCDHYGVVSTFSEGTIDNCTIIGCGRFGAFIVDGRLSLTDNIIRDSGQSGVRIVRGEHYFYNNSIYNSGLSHDVAQPLWCGIELNGAHASLRCNTIRNNEGTGLFLFAGSYADMYMAWNQVYDNMQAVQMLGCDFGQICFQGGLARLATGWNSIYSAADTGRLILNTYVDSISYNMIGNYWGTTDSANIAPRLPESTAFLPLLSQSPSCMTVPTDTNQVDRIEALFNQGWDEEHQGLFTAAEETYSTLIEQYPKSEYAKLALDRLDFCKEAQDWTWRDIRDYFLDLAADSAKDLSLVNQCKTTAAWCLANLGQFTDARLELEALIDTTIPQQDKIRLQLTLLMLDLKQNYDDSLFSRSTPLPGEHDVSSHLDAATTSALDMETAKLVTFSNRLDDLIAQSMGTTRHGGGEKSAPLPKNFVLYQNYPNPFNPITEIRFDLPERTNVELKVFDLLGREVAVLMHGSLEGGSHTATFDGSRFASGVYIYSLTAGSFHAQRKMILLK